MSDNVLLFEVRFHGPFRVGTGQAAQGIDEAVDLTDPVPASSLKGVMRDAARELALADGGLIGEVFGTEASASPWSWTGAEPGQGGWARTSVQARVAIDPETHTAIPDLLQFAETVEHDRAQFRIHRVGPVPADRLPHHVALLRVAAAAVHHLGGQRRRGLGWVTVTPLDGAGSAVTLTGDDLRLAREALRG